MTCTRPIELQNPHKACIEKHLWHLSKLKYTVNFTLMAVIFHIFLKARFIPLAIGTHPGRPVGVLPEQKGEDRLLETAATSYHKGLVLGAEVKSTQPRLSQPTPCAHAFSVKLTHLCKVNPV